MKICPINSKEIIKLIDDEIDLHPKLEPVDLYKVLYQALYGPFHIVRDFKQLVTSISSEIWMMKSVYLPIFQKIGPCYTRISLSAIRLDSDHEMNLARVECLARWILDSCVLYEDVRHHFLERWRENLDMMRQKLPSTSSAWDRANELAELGQLPSHSRVFHQHYQPHYRLVDSKLTANFDRFMELNK